MTQWERIEPLVKSSGLSMKQVADIAKVVPSAVNKWKAGSQIRFASLLRLADYFGVPVASLGTVDVTLVNQYHNYAREGGDLLMPESAATLKERIVSLEKQLERANETIASQARTIEAMQQGRTNGHPDGPAAPTAHAGGRRPHLSTSDERRAGA